MVEQTKKRKDDHIKISLTRNTQAKNKTTGFEDIYFIHKALPEISKETIDCSSIFLNHKFSAPLLVGALTGGTVKSMKINAILAEAVESLGLGMGVGSQRIAIENKKFAKTFAIVRKKAPTAFLIANIGGIQLLNSYGIQEVKQVIEMIDANAVAIHLNPLQESIQPEGQTNFQGLLKKIKEIAEELQTPIIVKETGAGIAAEEAKALENAKVSCIELSGAGGTSFAAVESYRTISSDRFFSKNLGQTFWDWGMPTAVSLVEVRQSVKIPVIASGGIRNGIDIAKALTLEANITSISQPLLASTLKGVNETKKVLSLLIEELKTTMFLVGADSINNLTSKPLLITGKTSEWLSLRKFNLEKYLLR